MNLQSKLNTDLQTEPKVQSDSSEYVSSIGEPLKENSLIDDCTMKYVTLTLSAEEQIAEARVCLFENNVSYIQLLKVKEKYQNNKIGTVFFKYLIDKELSEYNDKIFIKPTTKPMKIICKKHEFSASVIDSWYVKE